MKKTPQRSKKGTDTTGRTRRQRRQRTLHESPNSEPRTLRRFKKSFATIEREHRRLEQKVQEESFSGEQLDEVRAFMREAAFAGLTTRDSAQRDQLRAILRQWGTWVGDKTGKYPPITLKPWRGPGWFERAWPWARRGLVVLGIVIVAALVYHFGPQVYRFAFPTITQSDVLLIVARFDETAWPGRLEDLAETVGLKGSDAVTGESLAEKVTDRLKNTLGDQLGGLYVRRLRSVITDTVTADDLRSVPAAAPVTLVIGGVIGDGGRIVTPTLILTSTVADKPAPQPDIPALDGQPADLLPHSVTYGAAYVVGQLFLAEQRYQPALTAFSIAVQEAQGQADDTSPPPAGLEKAYLERAGIYRALEEWEQALDDYTAVININREDVAKVYLQRALTYLEQDKENKDNQDGAIQDLTAAIERGIDNPATAYYGRALVYYGQQNYEAAIADMDQAINLEYHSLSEAYYRRGLSYHKRADDQSDPQEARHDYHQALKDYTQVDEKDFSRLDILYLKRGLVYNQLGQYENAEDDFGQALENVRPDADYPDAAEVQYHLGIALAGQGNHPDAITAFSEVIDQETPHPRRTDALYHRGLSYIAQGHYAEAAGDFSTLLAEGEAHTDALFQRAQAFFHLHKYREAISDLNATLRQESSPLEAYYWRGRAYAEEGRYSLAIGDLTRAIENQVRLSEAYYYRGVAYYGITEYDLALQDWSSATVLDAEQDEQTIADLTEIISLDPDSPAAALAYYLRGRVYRSRGDKESLLLARADFDHALALQPDAAEVYRERALTSFTLQDYEAAVNDLIQTLDRDDAELEDYYWRGRAYFGLEEFEYVVQDLTEYLRDGIADQQTPQPALHQAEAYLLRGKAYLFLQAYDQARVDFEAAIQLAPDTTEAHLGRGVALFHLGEYEQAQQALSAATASGAEEYVLRYLTDLISLDPDSPTVAPAHYMRAQVYRDRGGEANLSLARDDFDAAIALQFAPAEVYRDRALTNFALQDYQAAVDDLTEALAQDSAELEDYYWRGQAYYELADFEHAVQDFTFYLQGDIAQKQVPQPMQRQVEVYLRRGNAYLSLGDYEQAKADFAAAVLLAADDSTKAQAYWGQAKALFHLGEYLQATDPLEEAILLDETRHERAIEYFSQLIASQPQAREAAAAYFMRARLLWSDGSPENIASALEDLDRSVQADPTFVWSHRLRAEIFQAQGNYEQAIAAMDEAIKSDPTNADFYVYRGRLYARAGDPTSAIADYTAALENNSRDPAFVYQDRGISRYQLQEYDPALADFDAALALEPNLAQSHLYRGLTYFQQGVYSRAMESLSIAIRTEPLWSTALGELDRIIEAGRAPTVLAWAYYTRGRVHLLLGDEDSLQRALKDLTEAIQHDPTFTDAYYWRGLAHFQQENYQQAISDFDQALEQDATLVVAYYRRGLARFQLADYDGTLGDLTTAIRLDPNLAAQAIVYFKTLIEEATPDDPATAPAYYIRGRLYQARGDEEGQLLALEDLTIAILRDPTFGRAYYDRGLFYTRLNAHAQAIADFTGSIELEYNVARAYYYRGLAQAQLDDPEAAIADLTAALEQDASLTDALYQRGLVYQRGGKYKLAIDDYTAYLNHIPNSAQVHFQRGLAYASQGEEGDRQLAVEDFTVALRLSPGWTEAIFQRGLAHAALGNRSAAETDFTAVLELDPTFSDALYRRGLIRLADGLEIEESEARKARLLQAVDDFGQVIAVRPQFADAYYNRARAHRALNRRELALADFEIYLELVPNAPDRLQVEQWITELRQPPTPTLESTPEPTPPAG